jgi:hypothetical protein
VFFFGQTTWPSDGLTKRVAIHEIVPDDLNTCWTWNWTVFPVWLPDTTLMGKFVEDRAIVPVWLTRLAGQFDAVGDLVGLFVGVFVGAFVGAFVGGLTGAFVGGLTGALVGAFVGDLVGGLTGVRVGPFVGCFVGTFVGPFVGALVGPLVGGFVGGFTGAFVGLFVGALVGGPKRGVPPETQTLHGTENLYPIFLLESFEGLHSGGTEMSAWPSNCPSWTNTSIVAKLFTHAAVIDVPYVLT